MKDEDLDGLPALTRRVEPLPGGLTDLRRRIAAETPRPRAVRWLALAVAGAGALVLVLVLLARRGPGDLAAARALFSGSSTPEAVAIGLTQASPPERLADGRLTNAPGDAVVFYWVPAREISAEP